MSSIRDSLRKRLAFDYQVVMAMANSSPLIEIQAFANQQNLLKRRHPITQDDEGRSVSYYIVHFDIRSLVGPGRYHKGYDVMFDLASHGTYPNEHAENTIDAGGIIATCISRPIPWSPHFLDGVGTICLGSIWKGAAHTLLAHIVIHVAKLLNWDEPMATSYGGWNPSAINWWKKNLGGKPITPEIEYPSLPLHITHGISANSPTDDFQVIEKLNPIVKSGDFQVISTTPSLSNLKEHPDGVIFL